MVKKCVLDSIDLTNFQVKLREAHSSEKFLSKSVRQITPIGPGWIARIRAIQEFEVAEQEAEETQAEETQYAIFTVLAEFSEPKTTFEGFKQGFNFPAAFPSAFDDRCGAWHG